VSGIQIKVDDAEIRQRLAQIRDNLGDSQPALLTIGEIIRTSIERNFAAQGRPVKWKPSKRVIQDGGETLSANRKLRNSFTVKADDRSVRVGANDVRAAVHQFGAAQGSFGTVAAMVRSHLRKSRKGKEYRVGSHWRRVKLPWGNIPARPFMMVQDEDRVEILEALNDFIMGTS
jgi:phage gpG-like protein